MKLKYSLLVLSFLLIFCQSCSVITGIFKAGVWVGVLLVLLILGVIVLVISRSNK